MRSALKLMYWCVVFACAREIRKSTLLAPQNPVVTVYTVRTASTDRFSNKRRVFTARYGQNT
jgi:hypothetical protein